MPASFPPDSGSGPGPEPFFFLRIRNMRKSSAINAGPTPQKPEGPALQGLSGLRESQRQKGSSCPERNTQPAEPVPLHPDGRKHPRAWNSSHPDVPGKAGPPAHRQKIPDRWVPSSISAVSPTISGERHSISTCPAQQEPKLPPARTRGFFTGFRHFGPEALAGWRGMRHPAGCSSTK